MLEFGFATSYASDDFLSFVCSNVEEKCSLNH